QLFVARVILQDDGAVLALNLAVDRCQMPVVELARVGDAPLEREVGVTGHSRELAHRRRVAALAILDDLNVRTKTAALGETRLTDAINLHEKAKDLIGINSGHRKFSFPLV